MLDQREEVDVTKRIRKIMFTKCKNTGYVWIILAHSNKFWILKNGNCLQVCKFLRMLALPILRVKEIIILAFKVYLIVHGGGVGYLSVQITRAVRWVPKIEYHCNFRCYMLA
jgi:hypothetical protein